MRGSKNMITLRALLAHATRVAATRLLPLHRLSFLGSPPLSRLSISLQGSAGDPRPEITDAHRPHFAPRLL